MHFLYFEIYNQKKRGVDFIDTQTLSGTRRDNGDGSISVRKDGTWTARIQVGRKANGKPQIKAFYGKTEVEVKRKLRNYKKEIAVVGSLDARKHSVETYIIKWLEIYKKNSISENGYDALESAVKNQVIPYLGYIQLINLTTENIQGMINGMLQKGYVVAGKEKSYSLSTIKKAYNAINACLKQAVLLGDLYKNPAMGVNLPSVKKNEQLELKEIVSFTDEEILKYIAEATRLYKTGRPVYRLGYALVIMLFTGIRQGEALALRWTDVDFENKVVNISRNFIITKNREKLSDADTNYIMIEKNRPKTISSIRKIPLNDKALNALTEIKKINGEHAHILSTKVGTVINPRNLYRMHENVCKKCNIKGCGLHSLRHTFASMLLRKGTNIKVVSRLLGHAETSTTNDIYIHLVNEQLEEAVDAINF